MKRPIYNAIYSLLFDPKHFLDALLIRLGGWIPDATYIRWTYYLNHGHALDLENPKRYTEKLQWLKLYYRDPLWTRLVDKYAVKDYVRILVENGCEFTPPPFACKRLFNRDLRCVE